MAETLPASGLSEEQVQALLSRLDELLGRLEGMPGPVTALALEAVEALTEVYGTALARVVALLNSRGDGVRELAADELVGHLLVLHGLHPDPVEQRIGQALDEVRLQLAGDVRLLGIQDGVARVEVTASGCGAAGLGESVGEIVLAAAPELAGVEPVTVAPPAAPALIPVEALLRRREVAP